ncbi:Light-harvesting complex I LH38 protein [Durusdinium trenchii]|uniref:Light-harvesting complex I LH38 protein n=1 Tax=Durusdinium trenchii TaxID=1381693 RepID=A0ABP0PXG6_9DINO
MSNMPAIGHAFECETTGTTESSPLSTENSSEVRQLHQRWHWSRCRWICCALVVTFVLLIVTVIGVNHAERSELLEPMLDMLEKASFCHAPAHATCSAEIPSAELQKFDLHPPQAEKALMGFMYLQVARRDRNLMREILSGAHLVLMKDLLDGKDGPISAYRMLEHWPGAYRRASSHRSDFQQYGIPQGEVLHTILLGRIGKTTWLQFEGNGVNGMVSFFFHMCDYLEYKVTSRNIGPLGTSKYTDRAPLLIQLPVSMDKQECPLMCNITSGASQTVLPYRAMTSTGSWHQLLRRLRRI